MMHLPLMPAAELVAWEINHVATALCNKWDRMIEDRVKVKGGEIHFTQEGVVRIILPELGFSTEEDISEFPSKTLLAKILLVAG